jgi:hypothetical protein
MPRCENRGYYDNLLAPQPECGCRMCYREREKLIPEQLRKFIYELLNPQINQRYKISGPSANIIRNCLMHYSCGKVSLESALVEIIKQLSIQNDKLFDSLHEIEMLKPVIPHLFVKKMEKER